MVVCVAVLIKLPF